MYINKKRGQSALEWGVLVPFLLLIIASVLELSPLMNASMTIDKATQYAAATASKKGTSNAEITRSYVANIQELTKNPDLFFYSDGSLNTDAIDSSSSGSRVGGVAQGRVEMISGNQVVTQSNFTVTSTNASDVIDNTLIVTPGNISDRYSGSWVSVEGKHEYRILTPLLQAVLGGNCSSGSAHKGIFLHTCDYFPISKTTIYRVE